MPIGTFLFEARKQSQSSILPSGGSLQHNIQQSETNLRQMNSGRRLSHVMQLQFSSKDPVDSGLPVFKNRNYSNDLQSLLDCPDLQQSFPLTKQPQLESIYNALKLAQKMEDEEKEVQSFVTQSKPMFSASTKSI